MVLAAVIPDNPVTMTGVGQILPLGCFEWSPSRRDLPRSPHQDVGLDDDGP